MTPNKSIIQSTGRTRYVAPILAIGLLLAVSMVMAPAATAAPAPVSGCQTLESPGAYALSSDLATVDATCIGITTSDVKLDLAGHTISCTGSGFEGSCQVPVFGPTGIDVAPNLSGVTIKGPGTIGGFDNGVFIPDGEALVRGVTVSGPPCNPSDCSRPTSNAILVFGRSSVNVLRNDVSNHARGVALFAQCPGADATCVVNGNTAHNNTGAGSCIGIYGPGASGYTITRNVATANGSLPCFPRGGIILSDEASANTIVNNDASSNNGFGIGTGPLTSANLVVNNTARGNPLADLAAISDQNVWNDNNRCNTESGEVPSTVCNAGE